MSTGFIIGLAIYVLGYIGVWLWSKKNNVCDGRIFDISVISFASWGILILYLIHWLHNKKW